MKKLISVFLVSMLLCTLPMIVLAEEASETDPTIEEGYMVEGDGWTSVVSWCRNEEGDRNIYGKFYYPEGFDEAQRYPTVIMSHGLGSHTEMVERAQWPQAALAAGYVVYTFDFCGGGMNSHSDLDFMEMSLLTEVSDLNAVIDFVKEHSFVDAEDLFLLGQSQGGAVSALTAAGRPSEIKAMVLVYPALCIVDDLHEFVPDLGALTGDTFESAMGTLGTVYARDAYDLDLMSEIAGYTGNVLIIHGINDKTVPYTYSVEALETAYAESNSNLLLIGGKKSVHGFEMIYDEGRECALAAGIDFLNARLG